MSDLAAPTFEQSAILLAWVAITLLAFAMSGLLRQVHALTQALEGRRSLVPGPARGMAAPEIPQLDGAKRSLLLFVDQRCSSCEDAVAMLAEGASRSSRDVAYLVLYRDDRPAVGEHAEVTTVAHASHVFDGLNVVVTPTAVALDERRRVIASTPVGSPDLLKQLVDYVSQGREETHDHNV